jgi:hypothetical protein
MWKVGRWTSGRTTRFAHGLLVALAVWTVWAIAGQTVAGGSLSAPARGSAASIAVLHVDIWPEHDDPRVLVIYRGQLSADAALPYTLTFTIPPSGQVNAAAYRSSDGALLSTDYRYRQDGDRLEVTFSIPTRAFQFEYYAELLVGRPRRSLVAEVVVPLPVETMRVAVEQPLRATAFTLSPPAEGTTTTAAGLTHHLYTVGRWPAGKVWRVRATYEKTDDVPSLPRASAPVGQPPSGTLVPATTASLWWWAAAVLAVLGVGALAAFWVEQRRAARRSSPRPAPGEAASRKNRRRSVAPAPVCAHCGFRARPGDRFCSRCGRPLRQS